MPAKSCRAILKSAAIAGLLALCASIPAAAQPPAFFNGYVSSSNPSYPEFLQFPDLNLFGYFAFGGNQWIDHQDMGWEYYVPANPDTGVISFYDSASTLWFYTSPSLFPLVVVSAGSIAGHWLWYYPDPNYQQRYTFSPRLFWDFSVPNGSTTGGVVTLNSDGSGETLVGSPTPASVSFSSQNGITNFTFSYTDTSGEGTNSFDYAKMQFVSGNSTYCPLTWSQLGGLQKDNPSDPTCTLGTPVSTNLNQTSLTVTFPLTLALPVGTYTIQSQVADVSGLMSSWATLGSITVAPASQTIAFGALANQVFGTSPFAVSATASSGLAVSFTSQTTSVCTVSGTTVTLVAAGTCTIQATQAGNANYAAATPVSQSFMVTGASQTITFGSLASQVFGTSPFAVSATASSGLSVGFSSQTTAVCAVSGTTVTLVGAGTCTIQATQSGNANYAAATPVNQSFTVTAASQTITFGALANQALGAPAFAVSATASSGLPVSFISQTGSVCGVSGATVTVWNAGTCTIEAMQAGNANYAAATAVSQSFTVMQASQTITFGPLANQTFGTSPFTVSATSSVGLAVSFNSQTTSVCTVSGVTVTLAAVGTCTIQATQAGDANHTAATPVSQSFTVTAASQTITFGSLANQSMGASPFAVSATASSGLAVSFNSQTTAVCTVSGVTVTLAAVGTCTIQATQAGNTNFAAAAPVSQSFTVTAAIQTITFGSLANQSMGASPFAVSATASSGLAVSFNSQTTAVCTVSGVTVTLAAVGTCTIQATQAGNTNFAAATPVSQSFAVTAASQTITFGSLAGQAFGSSPFAVGATASSGLPVSFTSQTTSVCTVSGTTVTLAAVGTCTIQATQGGNANYAAATPVSQSFPVTPENQTITFGSLASQVFGASPFAVSATASSGLAVGFSSQTTAVCTVSGTTVTLVGAGTCTIQATQTGNANYAAATPVSQSFTVTQASQTITFGSLASQVFGTSPFAVSATATSGLAVTFASQTTPVCTVSGTTVTLAGVGTCTIQAAQTGNANYAAAGAVTQSFAVTQASQSITFGTLASQAFGTAPFTVSATATSGLAVTFASQTTPVCTVSGATVTLAAVGTCTIQATQTGNANYAAATAVSQSFAVTQGSQTITFGSLANEPMGTAPFAVSATASSGLAVSFASQTTSVCTVSGTTVTLAAVGTCTIQATQAGNANYAAATAVSQSFTVTAASQTITFGSLANQVFGTAPFAVSATASSGLAVSFASQTTAVCTVSGTTVTLIAGGACTIQATQSGNANYTAAAPVNQGFTVTPASQTIGFGTISNQVLGTAPFTVSATASSGLTVSFTSQSTSVCTVSGTTVTLAAVGTCTIQAAQTGNASYAAATPVNESFSVTPAPSFTLSITPLSAQPIAPGTVASYLVSIVPQNGFSSSVTLSATGLAAGETAVFNPSTITNPQNSTLVIQTTTGTPTGAGSFTVLGNGGSGQSATLNVETFTMSLTPSAGVATITSGTSGLTPFSVSLTGPAGLQVALQVSGMPAQATSSSGFESNPTVTLQGWATAVVVPLPITTPLVTVATAGNTGTFTLAITASAGSISQVAPATLIVQPAPTLTVAVSPAELTIPSSGTAQFTMTVTGMSGYSGPFALGLANATGDCANITGYGGAYVTGSPVTVSLRGNGCDPTHQSWSTLFTIPVSVGQAPPAVASVLVLVGPNADYALTATPQGSTSVPPGGSATYQISVAATQGNPYPATLSVSGLPPGASASWTQTTVTSDGSLSLTITAGSQTPPNGYTIQVTGTNAANTTPPGAGLPFTVVAPQSFTLQPDTGILSMGASTTTTDTISVVGGSGFTGSVSLSVSGVPSGVTASISPSTVGPGSEATLTVTTGVAPQTGYATLTVTGTSGSLTNTAQIPLTIGGPVPATLIGPTPGAVLDGGSILYTWNFGSGVSQYALQVGSYPGGYDYANIIENVQYYEQAPGVLGAWVTLPTTAGQTVYATLSSTIGGVVQSLGYTHTIGSRASLTVPTAATISPNSPPVYNDGQPVDVIYTFASGTSPQLLGSSIATSDPTLSAQVVSVSSTTATVRFRANSTTPQSREVAVGVCAGEETDSSLLCPICDPLGLSSGACAVQCNPSNPEMCVYLPTPTIGQSGGPLSSRQPTITGLSFTSPSGQTLSSPVAGTTVVLTISGTNFGTGVGFVEACPSSGGGPCIDGTPYPNQNGVDWTTVLVVVSMSIPITAAGQQYCTTVTQSNLANFGGGSGGSNCFKVPPSVSISCPLGIAEGGSDQCSVTVAPSGNNTAIQLVLATSAGTTGSATFADGTTSMTITNSQAVTIDGVAASSTANNIQLLALVGVLPVATQAFSVVSVTISMSASPPSGDDTAVTYYMTGVVSMGPFGQVIYKDTGGTKCSVGVELMGKVMPTNYGGSVFLQRSFVSGSGYNGTAGQTYNGYSPTGSDNSPNNYLDPNPQPNGHVYDIDGPGINGFSVFGVPQINRVRLNFSEFAMLGDPSLGKYVGAAFPWYAAVSCTVSGGSQAFSDTVTGDNQAGAGTTVLSWNLQ